VVWRTEVCCQSASRRSMYLIMSCLCVRACPVESHTAHAFLAPVLNNTGRFYFRTPRKLMLWSRTLIEKLIVPQLVKTFLLRSPEVHYLFHKSESLVPSLSQTVLIHALRFCSIEIHFNIHLHRGFPSGPFPSGFPNQNTMLFSSSFVLYATPISFFII
jgi:hypothetical protein